MSTYSISKVTDLKFKDALARTKEELKKEGFGVLTEIDVKSTIKKKLGKDFKKYEILGACNPEFAHQALQLEEELGLLLPCNVIVYEKEAGKTAVSAIDPREALTLSDNLQLENVADMVAERLERVIENV